MRPSLLLLSCFLLSLNVVNGQRYAFSHLTMDDGLSHKSVISIAQDSRGFMWFGTGDGLNRYDARNFKVYNTEGPAGHSLSSNYILSILSDSRTDLWVGTSRGLHRYRPASDDFEKQELPLGSDGQAPLIIKCLYEDSRHRIWVGTAAGLFLIPAPGQPVKSFFSGSKPGLSDNIINVVSEDHAGNIWVGTDNGLTKMIPQGQNFLFEYFYNQPGHPGSIAGNKVASIVEDGSKQLWIGLQQKGLALYQPASRSFIHFSNPNDSENVTDNIRKIVADKKGQLWIGTQDGLNVFNTHTRTFTTYRHYPGDDRSLSQNSIYGLFIDRNETLWIGTFFGGINIAMPSLFSVHQSNPYRPSINNNVISSFVTDGKQIWVGTDGGGINQINRQTNQITIWQHRTNIPSSLSSNLIKVLYRDSDGNLWAGTSHGSGLNVQARGQSVFKRYLSREEEAPFFEIRALAEGPNNQFWVGTNTGLLLFERKGIQLTPSSLITIPEPLKTGPNSCLFIDSKKRMWIGGDGLYVYNPATGIRSFQSPSVAGKKLLEVRINCIIEDSIGRIWLGTERLGLFCYDPAKGTVVVYTENEGLANNNVYSIVPDEKGQLWIGTRNGLSCFAPGTGVFHNYTAGDGLAGNEFKQNAVLRLPDGEILLGGFNGFSSFYPSDITENTKKPAAFITGLRLFNEPVKIGDDNNILQTDISLSPSITLNSHEDIFTIEFASLNYLRAEKNKYAYRIEGLDRGWNYTSMPSATYNNLQPGVYHFLAKGSNNDGVWSDPVSLWITINPPWWRTWWAYGIYVLILLVIVFFVLRFFFLRALLKKDKKLTALKLNFFTNISHEISTYLSLITGPAEQLFRSKKDGDSDKRFLETIHANSQGLLQLVNELMDFRKAETGNLSLHIGQYNIVPFVQSVCKRFEQVSQTKNIITDFVPEAAKIDVWLDDNQMKKVFFNLLSNAYKFTPAGGYVKVLIDENDDKVFIYVTNSGNGIATENIDRLFDNYFQEDDYGKRNTGYGIGLAFSKTIAELHKGTLTVTSEPPKEKELSVTTFTLTLRKGRAHFDQSQIHEVSLTAPELDEEGARLQVLPEQELPEPVTVSAQNLETILLVEDNSQMRSFITESLRNQYTVIEAENGISGLAMATDIIPDIVISDVMMPEMDGYSFCQQLKTDERTNHIPVILLTARSTVTDHQQGLQKGADVYLTKPFSIQLLQLQVRNLLASATRMRERYSRQILMPEAEISSEVNEPVQNEFIVRLIAVAEEHLSDPAFGLEMLCAKIGMSQTVLYKKVKALTNMTVNEIVKNVRLRKAAELIRENDYTVYEVADMVGYSDAKYFGREFKKEFGMSVKDYRKNYSP